MAHSVHNIHSKRNTISMNNIEQIYNTQFRKSVNHEKFMLSTFLGGLLRIAEDEDEKRSKDALNLFNKLYGNSIYKNQYKISEKHRKIFSKKKKEFDYLKAKLMIKTPNTTNSNTMEFIKESKFDNEQLAELHKLASESKPSLEIYFKENNSTKYNFLEPGQARSVLNKNNMKIIETGSNKSIETLIVKAYADSLNNNGNPNPLNNFNIQKYYNKALSSNKRAVANMIKNFASKKGLVINTNKNQIKKKDPNNGGWWEETQQKKNRSVNMKNKPPVKPMV